LSLGAIRSGVVHADRFGWRSVTCPTTPSAIFDVVVFNHVVEHLADPLADLRRGLERLRSDGLVVIGVPNFGSWMARLRGANWASLQPQEHYWQFTRASFLRAIEPLNLQLVGFETTNYVLKWSLRPKTSSTSCSLRSAPPFGAAKR
jgi:2-polyprenyl-3-methyl-5-hydroxy-6-metoxy-1,4-benzoquinol methylase